MILNDDRTELDNALGSDKSICILRGAVQSDPGKVHACLEGDPNTQPWHRWFLVTDEALLSADEKSTWFSDNPAIDYAFLGCTTNDVTSNGTSSDDLLLPNGGECDFPTFLDKFAEADLS
jgi:hypothetical protein